MLYMLLGKHRVQDMILQYCTVSSCMIHGRSVVPSLWLGQQFWFCLATVCRCDPVWCIVQGCHGPEDPTHVDGCSLCIWCAVIHRNIIPTIKWSYYDHSTIILWISILYYGSQDEHRRVFQLKNGCIEIMFWLLHFQSKIDGTKMLLSSVIGGEQGRNALLECSLLGPKARSHSTRHVACCVLSVTTMNDDTAKFCTEVQ